MAWNHNSKTLSTYGVYSRICFYFVWMLQLYLVGQIVSCRYISSVSRTQHALLGGGGKRTVAGKVLFLCPPGGPSWGPSVTVCVYLCTHSHVCASECGTVDTGNVLAVDAGTCHGLTSSVLHFGKLLVWAHSQAERMQDTERGREIYSPEVITLLKTTSSHCVYLSHLSKLHTVLRSKSHFSRADDSVCSINFSLLLSQEQPL